MRFHFNGKLLACVDGGSINSDNAERNKTLGDKPEEEKYSLKRFLEASPLIPIVIDISS